MSALEIVFLVWALVASATVWLMRKEMMHWRHRYQSLYDAYGSMDERVRGMRKPVLIIAAIALGALYFLAKKIDEGDDNGGS